MDRIVFAFAVFFAVCFAVFAKDLSSDAVRDFAIKRSADREGFARPFAKRLFEFSGAGSRQWWKRNDGAYESDDVPLNGASFARHGGSDRDNEFAFAKRAQFAKRGGFAVIEEEESEPFAKRFARQFAQAKKFAAA
uniref:Uncharacterized protein n=1 Tax=Plectus sambesii TaxID=2011161 RepID=A0A914USN0_9BILA